MGWLVSFFHLRLCLFFTGFVNCCNCLGAAAGYLIAPRQPRKKKTYYIYIYIHYIHVFLVLFSPFANVTLNAFACEKNSLSFCQVWWPGFCGDLSSGQPHAEHLCGSWASGVRGLYHIIMSNLLASKGSSDLWIFSICQVQKALTMVEGSCIACLHLPTKSMYLVISSQSLHFFLTQVPKEWGILPEFQGLGFFEAKVLVGIFVCCPMALARHVSGRCYGYGYQLRRNANFGPPWGRLHATFGCLERGRIASSGDHCGMVS